MKIKMRMKIKMGLGVLVACGGVVLGCVVLLA